MSWFDRNKHRYPADWNRIATEVKAAAGWTCEGCGVPHGPCPHVLTVDHVVDHDPANCDPTNLVALCQRCHLRRQGMRPRPTTKAEALSRLRHRAESERSQLSLALSTGEEAV